MAAPVAKAASAGLGARLQALWNSPIGPKGLVDLKKPPEKVSRNMTGAMCVYSMLFMRFAWMVQPRNYLLFACHASNESVQFYHFQRRVRYDMDKQKQAAPLPQSPATPAAVPAAAAAVAAPAPAKP